MSRVGRPSPYAGREAEIAEQVVRRLQSGEPLAKIMRDDDMPGVEAFRDWRNKNPAIEAMVARARDDGQEVIQAECIDIADECIPEQAEVAKAKLRIETRLKLLACWNPKKYGDKAEIIHSGDLNHSMIVMTEDRRSEIMEKKQRAIARAHESPILELPPKPETP